MRRKRARRREPAKQTTPARVDVKASSLFALSCFYERLYFRFQTHGNESSIVSPPDVPDLSPRTTREKKRGRGRESRQKAGLPHAAFFSVSLAHRLNFSLHPLSLTCASTRAASIPLPMMTVVGHGTVALKGDESASVRACAGSALAAMAATSAD